MSGPAITVKDVWRATLPSGTELVGGGAGLERRVEWACAMRTRPPAFEAVKGGEVAFVPVPSIRLLDERLDLAQVMSSFAEKGGVAVAALGDVSQAGIELADRLVMPLLRLPDGTHIAEVHQQCVRFILDARTRLHERASELQTTLMQLALGGAGASGIIEYVARLTSLTTLLLDAEGAVRHTASDELDILSGAVTEQAPALRRWAETGTPHPADPPSRDFALSAAGLRLLASPIPIRQGTGGFVAVIGDDASLDELARLAVSRAAAACAIELDRERAVLETQERLEGEFVASLLSGAYVSDMAATDRARRLGFDLDRPFEVFVLRGADPAALEAGVRTARVLLQRREVAALLTVHDGALCGIVELGGRRDDSALQWHVEAIRQEAVLGRSGAVLSAGIGRQRQSVAGVRASHREAEQALVLGTRFLGAGHTVRFVDLGLHRLLASVAQHPELLEFYEQTVGPLLAYDARTGGDLMATLDAFFMCHGSPTDTAHRLNLHRNTVLYRLRRIEEVGGLNLDVAATRLNLHLCLRIRDVLPDAQPALRR